MNFLLNIGAIGLAGWAVGKHVGVLEGVAAALVVYALMPLRPRSEETAEGLRRT